MSFKSFKGTTQTNKRYTESDLKLELQLQILNFDDTTTLKYTTAQTKGITISLSINKLNSKYLNSFKIIVQDAVNFGV